jgi:hypothetical protein
MFSAGMGNFMNLSRALASSILLLAMRSAVVAQRPNVSANASTRTKSGKTAPAGTRKPAARNSELSVTVYVEASIGDSTLAPIRMLAQGIASGMFATAGVHINWRTGRPKASEPERPILIEFTSLTPKTLHPGALAYAYVFEGVHIRIFYDRVRNADRPYVTAMLLAHVMVHEITHILEGVNRHSEEGVMKARWTANDLVDMEYKPLPFDPLDVLLIRKGLANRGHAPRKEPPGPILATRPDAGISGWPILIQEDCDCVEPF